MSFLVGEGSLNFRTRVTRLRLVIKVLSFRNGIAVRINRHNEGIAIKFIRFSGDYSRGEARQIKGNATRTNCSLDVHCRHRYRTTGWRVVFWIFRYLGRWNSVVLCLSSGSLRCGGNLSVEYAATMSRLWVQITRFVSLRLLYTSRTS